LKVTYTDELPQRVEYVTMDDKILVNIEHANHVNLEHFEMEEEK